MHTSNPDLHIHKVTLNSYLYLCFSSPVVVLEHLQDINQYELISI